MKYEANFESSVKMKDFYECFVWKMPGRNNGRSTIHVETILFAEVILHYLTNPFWDYPVTVKYHDRPDFVIKSRKGHIGIEITEQWSKNFGHAMSMLESSNGFMEPSDFAYAKLEKKIKGKQINKLVSKQKLTGPPSMGYQEEINWVKRTIRTIERKDKKYSKYPKKNSFDSNILVIFDVRPECLAFEDVTLEMLTPLYSLAETTNFTKILCLDNHFVTIDLKKKKFEWIKAKPHIL